MEKRCRPIAMIFLAITVASSAIYCHTNSNNHTYAQEQLPNFPVGVKIISPAKDQKVPAGELEVTGISTDNATTDCQVYVDLNDIKPMQNITATGASGQNDYSNWTFTYTNKYHLISEGINELTAKLSCINNPANVTKYYSVNVTGVATSTAAANSTTTAPTSNTTTKNETTIENNNQMKVSTDTVNQTRKQTLQIQQEPEQEMHPDSELPITNSVPQPLKETQKQEEEAQKESMIDGQKSQSSTLEVVPLDESSYDSNTHTEEPEEIIMTHEDEERLTELTEPAGELPDYAYDQEQIDKDEPLTDKLQSMETLSQPEESQEQQPLEGQKVPPEMIEQQPLEESQPLETLSQPEESQELQPLEALEATQPIEEPPIQSFSHKTQPLPSSEIQPLEQQQQPALSEQQAPGSTIYAQEQPRSSVNEVEQPYGKDNSIPFVLPFDS
jgi:hypothetical protein